MLRAVSSIYVESQALELLTTARRDVFKLFRTTSTTPAAYQTVLTSSSQVDAAHRASGAAPPPQQTPPPDPTPPPPRPPPNSRQAWTVAAAALAVTASIGGVYFYRKMNDDEDKDPPEQIKATEKADADKDKPTEAYPALGSQFPAHVQYLLVGAGTASFAAMRAIRSARPDAQVLLVGEEPALPYMRPPLSKELWREPELARAAASLDTLTFRQWNGKRRSVVYEPAAFYAPIERLAANEGGACVARGWRVEKIDVDKHEASLVAAHGESATVRYGKVLVAPGLRARRSEALRAARAGGRVLTLRAAADAARLAALLDRPDVTRVAVLGGGFLASELSAALADRLRGTGATVTQLYREEAPMAGVLPRYLAAEAARRLQRAGVALRPGAEVCASAPGSALRAPVRLGLADGGELEADLVVECVGSEVDPALAQASGLETHPALGGLLVNAELQARSDVYAAGDAACFYDVALGRRRVEHHDHAVVSGRLAGENMAALAPPKHYTHQSMFWSDLGPDLGYEAIGIVDSRLPTVGVFSADAVADAQAGVAAQAGAAAADGPLVARAEAGAGAEAEAEATDAACARRYERGVVFYLRERRVVGVLLWNLFNRMHVARQVLKQGEFEDLFEVAKLFTLHEDD